MNKICIHSGKTFSLSCVVLLCLFLLFSCREAKEIREIHYKVDASITEFPDSSFFSDIKDMQYENDRIYALDASRRDIVVFDENFGNFHAVGTPGPGPEELIEPYKFYASGDTVYASDYGDMHIKCFVGGTFAGSIKVPDINYTRFFYLNNTFYTSYTTDSSSIVAYPKHDADKARYFGNLIRYDEAKATQIRNDRHLLPAGNSFFAVSDNNPVIEEYDVASGELMSTIDFSETPIIKENLSNIAKKAMAPNQYYCYLGDAYISGAMLYVLCANVAGDNFRKNTIIKISLEKKEVLCTYKLPGQFYGAFCVTPDYLFAFESHNCRIERFELDDDE